MIGARWWSSFIVAAMLAGPALGAEQVPVPEACAPAPDEPIGAVEELPRVSAALRSGGALEVLVVGTTQSPGHVPALVGVPGVTGYATRMAEAVEAAVPGLKVDLTIRGRHGATAGETADLIREEVASRRYSLVIWQTGTIEAVRNIPPDDFMQSLLSGIDAASSTGADVILVGPQYSRFLQTHADVEPYEHALEEVSGVVDVAFLPRFDLMRRWAEEGQLDLERVDPAQRRPTLELLHTCLGAYLARMVLTGLHS